MSFYVWKKEEEKKETEWLSVHEKHFFYKHWVKGIPDLPLPSSFNEDNQEVVLEYAANWRSSIREIYMKILPFYRKKISPPSFPYKGPELDHFILQAKILNTMLPRQICLWFITSVVIVSLGVQALQQGLLWMDYYTLIADFNETGERPLELRFPLEKRDLSDLYTDLSVQQSIDTLKNEISESASRAEIFQEQTPANEKRLVAWAEWERLESVAIELESHAIVMKPSLISASHFVGLINPQFNQNTETFITNISYDDALWFVAEVNRILSLPHCYDENRMLRSDYQTCEGWRLPTEKEWEKLPKINSGNNWIWTSREIEDIHIGICPVSKDSDLACTLVSTNTRSSKISITLVRGGDES